MQDDLKNIWSQDGETLSQDALLKYLNDELTPIEKHAVEKKAVDDVFESDALDGLSKVKNEARLELMVEALNRDLKKRTRRKKNTLDKRQFKTQWTLYFSIIIFLIIIVLVYLFLHKGVSH